MQSHKLTFGVEEEFIVVNPQTGLPSVYDFAPFATYTDKQAIHFSPEMHETVLEIKSPVCSSLTQLCQSLEQGRTLASTLLQDQGLVLMASGTHPSAHWRDIPMVAHPMYQAVVDEYQDVARSNFIFGMHLHIGFADPSLLVPLTNAVRETIPLILALSSNSPFWQGAASGLHSYRSRVFEKLPRTGIPDLYQNLEEYNRHVDWLMATGCIKKPTSIWSDIRIHPYYQTLEIRVADMQTKTHHAQAVAMFMAGLCMLLISRLSEAGYEKKPLGKTIVEENKWRAARWGLDADFIVSEAGEQRSVRALIETLLVEITSFFPTAAEQKILANITHILAHGSGASDQLQQCPDGVVTPALLRSLIIA